MTTCWSSNTRAGLGSSLSVRIMSIFVSFSYNNPRAGGKYLSISLGAFVVSFFSGQHYAFSFRGVYKDNWNYFVKRNEMS